MKTNWTELYNSIERAEEELGEDLKIRKDPHDPKSKLLTKAELAYYKTRAKVFGELQDRRGPYKHTRIIYKLQATRKANNPDRVFKPNIKYNFLQYIYPILEWAKINYKLNEFEVMLCLYLYPTGVFDKHEVDIMAEAMQCYLTTTHKGRGRKGFARLRKKGVLEVWYRASYTEPDAQTLYQLVPKYRAMCTTMHEMALGERGMATSHINPLNKDKSFKGVLERMNEAAKNKKDPEGS